jgi:hypothetical protein
LIKRIIINHIRDKKYTTLAIWNQFYKLFITLNKNELLPLQTMLLEHKKTEILTYITREFEKSFNSLQLFLCSRK